MSIKQERQEWRETSLKGRMAESLVHDLLQESGNEVYKIGYEAILPGLARIEESFKRNSSIGEKIRAVPDFFVINKSGQPYLVEVKFRWNFEWHEDDYRKLEHIKNYWGEAVIIVVGCSEKPYFRLCHYPFNKNKIITDPLQEFESFDIPDKLLEKFDVLVVKYLKPTQYIT